MLTEKGWLSELDFAECFTLAQLTPGPNAVNLAAMVGVRLGGWWGAAAAVTGILLPGLVVMLGAAALTLGLPQGLPPTLQSALRGAACAALGVMLSAALPVLRVSLGARGGWALAGLTLLGLGVLRWPLLPVLLGVVALGLWLNRPQGGAHDL